MTLLQRVKVAVLFDLRLCYSMMIFLKLQAQLCIRLELYHLPHSGESVLQHSMVLVVLFLNTSKRTRSLKQSLMHKGSVRSIREASYFGWLIESKPLLSKLLLNVVEKNQARSAEMMQDIASLERAATLKTAWAPHLAGGISNASAAVETSST